MTTDHPDNPGSPRSDATKVAARLTRALRENTEALRAVQRRQRRATVAMVLLGVMVVAGGFLFWQVDQTQNRDCDRDNEMRAGLLGVADYLDQGIDRAESRGSMSPEDVERNREFVDSLRVYFALHGCP